MTHLPVVLCVRRTCSPLRTSALTVQLVRPVKRQVVPSLLSNRGNHSRSGQHPVEPLPDYVDIGIISGRERLCLLFVTFVSNLMYCALKLCTVISTLRWAVLTVLWIGFCHTGPISLWVDLFLFICVYFVCFCFILHTCCIIVSTVGWTWRDWSLILRTYLPSVLWHCWLGHLTQ